VCRFHVAGTELHLDRCHKQIVWCVAKPASINLRKWFLSPTGSIKPWFCTKGNSPLCSSYLPMGFPTGWLSTAYQCLISFLLIPTSSLVSYALLSPPLMLFLKHGNPQPCSHHLPLHSTLLESFLRTLEFTPWIRNGQRSSSNSPGLDQADFVRIA
jgi:hypothetical protein